MAVHVCPPDHRHGENLTCYTAHRCKCPACRRANAEHAYWWRHMAAAGRLHPAPVDATGTRRRIEALMLAGWSQAALAARLGTDQRRVSVWMRGARVRVATRDRVAAVFAQLVMLAPSTDTPAQRMSVHRTRALAARRGYLPAAAWDDIDDLCEQPAAGTLVQERVSAGEVLDEVELMLSIGESPEQVLAIVGRSASAIAKAAGADRYGRPRLAAVFGTIARKAAA